MVQLNFPDYCASNEDVPMKLLVGMVGTDGWIIAADRRQREVAPDVGISSATDKLIVSSACDVVYASAGDDLARRTGDEIIKLNGQDKLPLGRGRHEELRLFLKDIASKIWRREARDSRGTYPPAINERGLLLGFKAFPFGVLVLMIGRHSDAYWLRSGAKTFGDTGNGAKYFLERYFKLYRSKCNLTASVHGLSVMFGVKRRLCGRDQQAENQRRHRSD